MSTGLWSTTAATTTTSHRSDLSDTRLDIIDSKCQIRKDPYSSIGLLREDESGYAAKTRALDSSPRVAVPLCGPTIRCQGLVDPLQNGLSHHASGLRILMRRNTSVDIEVASLGV